MESPENDHPSIAIHVHRPRSRSRSRLRNGNGAYLPVQDHLLSPRRVPRTVTFDLGHRDSQSSVSSVSSASDPYDTTVSLANYNTSDADSVSDHASFTASQLGRSSPLSHFLHRHETPAELANRLSSAIQKAVPLHKHNNRRFIPAGLLDRILDARTVEKALEILLPQPHQESTRRFPSIFRRGLGAFVDPDPESTADHHGIISNIANAICHHKKGVRNIFATLLLIKNPADIFKFIQAGLTDADLPLRKLQVSTSQHNSRDPEFVLCPADSVVDKIVDGDVRSIMVPGSRCLEEWSVSWVDLFEEKQWETIAHVFYMEEDRTSNHYRLHDRTILPFKSCKSVCRGGRGEILRVEIHPNHHNFPNSDVHHHSIFTTKSEEIIATLKHKKTYFAVKKVSMADQEDHRNEGSILKRIDDQHVIALFATYEHCGFYHLVMPWAKCNLEDFWRKEIPNPNQSSNALHWMARQCLGIANGLNKVQHHLTNSWSSLHESNRLFPGPSPFPFPWESTLRHQFFGRHGDIKPQNLLWFPGNPHDSHDLGVIKISDFGEGEFNKSKSSLRSTGSISYTPSYRPPECDHPDDEIEIQSATFDTWSLGCLYLEFITWWVGGWELVLKFEKARFGVWSLDRRPSPFFVLTDLAPPEPHANIKPAVTALIQNLPAMLEGTPEEQAFIIQFLNLIRTNMLVIDPRHTHRNAQSEQRLNCHGVTEELGRIGKLIDLKEDMDEDYKEDEEKPHGLRNYIVRQISTASSSRSDGG